MSYFDKVLILSLLIGSMSNCAADTTPPKYPGFPEQYVKVPTRWCFNYVLPSCSPQWTQCACNKPVFNVSDIGEDWDYVRIGADDAEGRCGPSCLLNTSISLPRRPNVVAVWLIDIWVAPDDGPFPVGRFLRNVQPTVRWLRLVQIHLPTLSRVTFAGFAALEKLQLIRNRMSAIALDAFASLSATPTLNQFWSEGNPSSKFDLAVLKPVAASLRDITLRMNDIEEIYFSEYFPMPAVEWVDLAGNSLTRINDTLLASVSNAQLRPYLRLGFNRFCVNSAECRCSSLDNLWSFFLKAPRNKLLPRFFYQHPSDELTCGNYTIWPESPQFESRFVPFSGRTDGRDYYADVISLARTRLKALLPDKDRLTKHSIAHALSKSTPKTAQN
ncbi:uncharacterized protein LOC129583049 [Paramacrobiotus metropolitanus]|uniref:uncharacterized protein LOC129583049 n=1 Tax=Paramacrobiotus metropolitanus TaxID=2943436 RepID=UPI0024459C69|nr:uncharacterized protein LOC129583049 [Paramacrobiotus metropolitanus]